MKPNIIYVHGAEIPDSGTEGASLMLRFTEYLSQTFTIDIPKMRNPFNPDCEHWMETLDAAIHTVDNAVTLIGHSLGAAVILKYLAQRTIENPVESVHLLATPFWGSLGWSSETFEIKENDFHQLEKFESLCFYHCEDDQVVPINHMKEYKQKLPHIETFKFYEGGHHFNTDISKIFRQVIPSEQITLNH